MLREREPVTLKICEFHVDYELLDSFSFAQNFPAPSRTTQWHKDEFALKEAVTNLLPHHDPHTPSCPHQGRLRNIQAWFKAQYHFHS